MSVETKTISAAIRELAQTIQCGDGVANAACAQAAERLDAQADEITHLRQQLAEAQQCYDSWFALSDLISRLRYGEITAEQLLKECEKPLEKAPPQSGEAVVQAHMAGQIDAGVDPSYSNAQAYANTHPAPVVPDDKYKTMLIKKLDLIRCGIGGNYGGDPFQNPLYTEVVELLSAAQEQG